MPRLKLEFLSALVPLWCHLRKCSFWGIGSWSLFPDMEISKWNCPNKTLQGSIKNLDITLWAIQTLSLLRNLIYLSPWLLTHLLIHIFLCEFSQATLNFLLLWMWINEVVHHTTLHLTLLDWRKILKIVLILLNKDIYNLPRLLDL